MTDIRKLTIDYVSAFDARDLNKVADYFSEEFELTDPEVVALTPKANVIKYIKSLFDNNEILKFEAHSIFVDGDVSVIHFTLKLGNSVMDGCDLIKWHAGQMQSMRAYMTQRST